MKYVSEIISQYDFFIIILSNKMKSSNMIFNNNDLLLGIISFDLRKERGNLSMIYLSIERNIKDLKILLY